MKRFCRDQFRTLGQIELHRTRIGLPGFYNDIQALIVLYDDGGTTIPKSSGKKFCRDQIFALGQIEIRRILKGLPGFYDDIQALIDLHKDGGAKVLKSSDPRLDQAKVLWDKGIGCESGFETFEAYLMTVPQIPVSLLADDSNLPLLWLVDSRLSLVKTCEIIGVKFEEPEKDPVPCDDRHEMPIEPFWVRAHSGRRNHYRRMDVCRNECKDNLFAMTAMVAIMGWAQDRSIIKNYEHVLDCPGSVRRLTRHLGASLGVWHGEVILHMDRYKNDPDPYSGSGAFRRG